MHGKHAAETGTHDLIRDEAKSNTEILVPVFAHDHVQYFMLAHLWHATRIITDLDRVEVVQRTQRNSWQTCLGVAL
jgi:hypothetical protein